MSNRFVGRKTIRITILCFLSFMALSASCNRQTPDPRLPLLEEQTKLLMISEAQQAFNELYKSTFNADKTQLLVGPDLKRFLEEKKKTANLAPEAIRTSIANSQGVGLLINDAVPGKTGGTHGVIYLRPSRGGFSRFFLTLDPDPCGDGNPATCENCTGCSGIGSGGGTFKTCVCTESCSNCRSCAGC
jgi:hypothetical protein